MPDYTIYALRVDWEGDAIWKPRIMESLKQGIARYGWSRDETADLQLIRDKIGEKESLSDYEKEVWNCNFLLEVKPDDYLIYINLPEYGKCTLARASGSYSFIMDGEDFNHRIPVDLDFVSTFDRNSNIVPRYLAARLKLQGRYWRIYAKREFESLLKALIEGRLAVPHTTDTMTQDFETEISPLLRDMATCMSHTYPNFDLEGLVEMVLKEVPGVFNVQRRRGGQDYGADIVFEYGLGLPFDGFWKQERCAVQVKSYEGDMEYQKAIQDLRKAFDRDPNFTSGLVVSTALEMTTEFEQALDKLREDSKKTIGVLLGEELARFYLKYKNR